ncbi:MAG: SDR family oxidoreductase [Caldilineaceae bacterium]|nr:SDR family oxidoreductase [Caldilineaceae bacterium]
MQFAEKVALVTGGGSGIGRATALALAADGAKVAVLELREDRAKAVAAEIAGQDGEAVAVTADISDATAMEQAVQQVGERWGRIDLVAACAGINGVWAPIEELRPEEWDETINVNLRGTFLTVKYAVPYLKRAGGAIVVISSVNGTRMFSNTGATAYASTKAAQIAFMKMMALELAPHHIRINAICPGAIDTNIEENTTKRDTEAIKQPVEFPEGAMPLKGSEMGSPKQVAQLITFLLSDNASHITGTEMWIDGAQSLLQG